MLKVVKNLPMIAIYYGQVFNSARHSSKRYIVMRSVMKFPAIIYRHLNYPDIAVRPYIYDRSRVITSKIKYNIAIAEHTVIC